MTSQALPVASIVLTVLCVTTPPRPAVAASFQWLGPDPGERFNVEARDVSADGSTVVGWGRISSGQPHSAFVYDALSDTTVWLNDLLPDVDFSEAYAVSGDGSLVVGWHSIPRGVGTGTRPSAFVYDVATQTLTGLGTLSPLDPSAGSRALDISDDGSTIVGVTDSMSGVLVPFRYVTATSSMSAASLLRANTSVPASSPYAVSSDGSVFAGIENHPGVGNTSYVLGPMQTTPEDIGALQTSGSSSVFVDAVSADGTTLVGISSSDAFTYDVASDTMSGLDRLPNGGYAFAIDVSADGATVVGYGSESGGVQRALVWRDGPDVERVEDVLRSQGVELATGSLTRATGVSADGQTIVGFGNRGFGRLDAWIATLDAVTSTPGDYNASGQVEQGDLDLVLQNWGRDTVANGVPTGWTNDLPDGLIDQAELDGVLLNWGATAAPNFGGASVPEPGVFFLAVMLWCGGGGRIRG